MFGCCVAVSLLVDLFDIFVCRIQKVVIIFWLFHGPRLDDSCHPSDLIT